MNPNENSQPSRVDAVWKHMVGMFGGDAVERKYGKLPPAEWKAMLSRLKEVEIDRGIRRLAYSGKPHVPTLPEFTKLCRAVADDGIEEGPRPVALPAPDAGKFDGWDITGNNRFMNYVKQRLAAQPRAWGVPGSTRQADATRIAVAYKNAWARDMREGGTLDPATGEFVQPTREVQDSTWIDTMKRAESDIAALMREKAA